MAALVRLLHFVSDDVDPYTAPRATVSAWRGDGNRAIRDFLDAFREPTSAPWVNVVHTPSTLDPDDLQSLQVELDLLLNAGFEATDEKYGGRTLPLKSLAFGVWPVGRDQKAKRSAMTRKERRVYDAPGAYVLQLAGSTHDLVLYLVLTLLTAEGMAGAISRCAAPARGNYSERCTGWVVSTGRRRKEYCGVACRVRQNSKSKAEQLRKDSAMTRRRTTTKKETRR